MPSDTRASWPDDPVDNRDDLEKRAARYRDLLGVEDLDALTDQLVSLREARRKAAPLPRRHYDLGGDLPDGGLQIVPHDPGDELAIAWARRPKKALASWGLSGRYVKVSATEPFGFARLRFALPAGKRRHLYPGTVVAARWDDHLERFRLIPASGYSESGGYVYAQITRPGVFTAIGLPCDPRLLLALRVLSTLAPWAVAADMGETAIVQPMLDTLFSQPLISAIAENDALLDVLGCRKEDFSADLRRLEFGASALDEVIDRLPELDLLDALGVRARMIKPVPDLRLPEIWPMPPGGWQSLGPATVSGRIKALAIHPDNGDILYAGAAGGGVWKTTNRGRDWFPTMHDEASLAIGGLAIAPSRPDILYAATGEWTGGVGRPFNPADTGAGVLRTSDGGRHWERCTPIDSAFCSSVAVDPTDPNRVYVGGEAGLYRSRDGGVTWDRGNGRGRALLEEGPVSDVKIAHDDPRRLYAGVHLKGVYRSRDGGDTWERLRDGLETEAGPLHGREAPSAVSPKIALGRHGEHGSRFVALKMANRIYLSRDGGDRFVRSAADTPRSPKDFYPWCSVIALDPRDEGRIYAGSVDLFRSDDAGANWTPLTAGIHEDQQALAFDPRDPDRVVLANDGGVWDADDRGDHFYLISDGLVAGQFYNVAVSQGPKLRVAGAMHDESAHLRGPGDAWRSLGLLEGGVVAVDPADDDLLYHASYSNTLHRLRNGGEMAAEDLGIATSSYSNQSVAICSGDAGAILVIANIGQDLRGLTTNCIVRLGRDEGAPIRTVLGPEHGPFTALVVAPGDGNIAYAGTAGGALWWSRDGGRRWSRLCNPAPEPVAALCADGSEAKRVFVVAGAAQGDTELLRVDRVADAKAGDVKITRLGAVGGGRHLAPHPVLEQTLHLATDRAVWTSFDGGETWTAGPPGLRRAFVTGLAVRRRGSLLFASTLGGGQYCVRL